MAIPQDPLPAKLIVAVMTADPRFFDRAVGELEAGHGPLDATSPEIRDEHFEYYEEEMGGRLAKKIVTFEKLIDPGELAPIKIHTTSIERSFSVQGRRIVNLDPGYLTSGNLVLASSKPRARRIYLRDGIYAELELTYESGGFSPLPWTYPDYRQPQVLSFLQDIRDMYLRQLKE